MSSLAGKKILVGISGSIAAYKIPHFVRLLTKAGADVQIISTPAALDFVSPLSLSTVSKHPVLSDIFSESQWSNHVMLGRWADLMIIAPATCNTLAQMSHGLCDNLLMAVYLSAHHIPIAIAPAMDEDMYHHPAVQENIKRLSEFPNHHLLPVEEGELASGLHGKGRMMEPESMVDWIDNFFSSSHILNGKKVLITAGPTYEMIDPVRFIGNFSSGKMGIALAEEAARMGAEVHLILGPTHLRPHDRLGIQVEHVTSADDMLQASLAHKHDDIIICAAAVADYKPSSSSDHKIKKSDANLDIHLIPNPDILKTLGLQKQDGQIVVGFALETDHEQANAKKKLESKNADMIVLNSLNDVGAGFGHDTNKVTLVTAQKEIELPLMSKDEVARHILLHISPLAHTSGLPNG